MDIPIYWQAKDDLRLVRARAAVREAAAAKEVD